MKTRLVYTLLVLCGLIACTPTTSDNSQQLLDDATSHFSSGKYSTAKLLIDSIHTHYPKKIEIRKQARQLFFQIEKEETIRTLAYMDSVIPTLQAEWDQKAKKFVLTDTTYLPKPFYQHKTFAKQAPCTTLTCEIDQQGGMHLISSYNGRALDHIALKVAYKDIYAETDTIPLGNVYNNQFTDLGIRWEYLTFDTDKQANVIGFIEMYADNTLKVTLHGKRNYTYYLPKSNAIAIKESAYFAQLTAQLHQLKQEYQKLTDKKIWLDQNLAL